MRVIIGIDTGVNTGFALMRGGIYETVASFTAVQAENIVLSEKMSGADLIVYVEDARLAGKLPKHLQRGHGADQGVGSVKRDSARWNEFLTYHNIPHVMISPRANKYKKCSVEMFERLTGWAKRSNGHGRDAAVLILGAK
jgi:hypothetical protein